MKKTKLLTLTLIVTILLSITTIAYAENTDYSVAMSLTSNSKLKEGDTITVKLNITSINAGDGIDTITATLDYDPDVFETITSSNITAEDRWTPSYADSTKMLILQRNDKITEPKEIITIQLKVKSVINVNSTTIKLKEIIASGGRIVDGGTGDIKVNDATITIVGEQTQNQTEQNNNKPTTQNTTKKDNTVSKTQTLPKTGLKQYGIMAIIIVLVVAIFSYVLYKKIAKDVK